MNTIALGTYTAVIRQQLETDEFKAEVHGIQGGANLYGKTSDELRSEFRVSLALHAA